MKWQTELIEGPRGRFKEFVTVVRVMFDFVKGFRSLHFTGPCLSIFGSSRFDERNVYYQAAREFSRKCARLGYTIITGGGPGVMEATNRGAKDVEGVSLGVNIQLPNEQKPNIYLDKWVTLKFFFVRKVLLLKYSHGFIAFPGGFGTMDELFETLTLVQTGKLKRCPIVLYGTEYWEGLLDQMKTFDENHTINAQDLNLILVTNSIDEAVEHFLEMNRELHRHNDIPKAQWWLFEKP